MTGRAAKIIISAILSSLLLLLIGLLVSLVVSRLKDSLGLVYFIIGGIPLVIFSPGLFGGGKSGAIHTPKVIYRFVNTLGPGPKASQPGEDSNADFNASLSWVLAGLIVWAVSYFV
jgi:hypothetical protein